MASVIPRHIPEPPPVQNNTFPLKISSLKTDVDMTLGCTKAFKLDIWFLSRESTVMVTDCHETYFLSVWRQGLKRICGRRNDREGCSGVTWPGRSKPRTADVILPRQRPSRSPRDDDAGSGVSVFSPSRLRRAVSRGPRT
jgi:hypothetical protein